MSTTIVVRNVVKKSALRNVQVAGKSTPVIDTHATAARRPTSSSASPGVATHWLNEHLEIGRTVSVEGLPKAQTGCL